MKIIFFISFIFFNNLAQVLDKIDPHIFYLKNSTYQTTTSNLEVPISFNNAVLADFGLSKNTKQNIKVVIKLKDRDLSEIKSMRFLRINSIFENTITAELPLDKIEELALLTNIQLITLGKPVESFLDAADVRVRGRIGRSTFGLNGQGVILGFIDTGIDITHEDFKDDNGNTRIKYIWDQKDAIGPHPSGYTYGTEWNSTQINSGICRTVDTDGHGSLVAGVAAGNGRATGNNQPNNIYVGIAPKADIIVVKLDFSNYANIIDAILWLDSKALQLNKPWVVNLSIGSQWGPRDATSPFDQAIFGVQNQPNMAKGRIIVAAVGNYGYDPNDINRIEKNKIHASGISTTSTRTFSVNSVSSRNDESLWLEVWYPENSYYNIRLRAPNGTWYGPYGKGQGNTEPGYALRTTNGIIGIHNEHFVNNYYAQTAANLIEISLWEDLTTALQPGTWQIEMNAVNNTGRWDAYIVSDKIDGNSYFSNTDYDNTRIVSEPSTANQVIAVGSFNTKNSWINESGQTITKNGYPLYQISYFSSPGPSRDGRTKPDIYAPGAWIASSKSGNAITLVDHICRDGEHYHSKGTSLSAPFVAGTVALLLQQNSNYTFANISNILNQSQTSQGYLDIYAALDINGDPVVGIEDAIIIYLNNTNLNVNQQYIHPFLRSFIDNFPYGHYITEWYNWKITCSSTIGDILIYDSPSGDIFIPALPSGYMWNTNEYGNILATISTGGMDNSGHIHYATEQITIRNVLSILGFTQAPVPIFKGSSGNVVCSITQGSGNPFYSWSLIDSKPGLSLTSNNSQATISYFMTEEYSSVKKISADDIGLPLPKLRCSVNNGTISDTKYFTLFLADQPPTGGCPFVYTWNGEDWMEDNNILPQSQDSSILGQDVTDFYQLYSKPRIEEDKYYLAVGEFEHEKSYLDQLKLLVVDHPQETFITVSDEGQVIQFAKPANFASAELDSEDVYKLLYGLDGEQVAVDDGEEMALSFEGVSGSEEPWLLIIGQVPHAAKEKLVGNILGENKESFTSFRLRRNPFYQWAQVPANDTSSLQVNILWKGEAEVDYTELSRRLELPFTLYTPELINAEHNIFGDVKNQLLMMDEDRTELNPNEWITLEFSAPPVNEGMERSFVFVSRGRYETLPDATVLEGKKQIPLVKKKLISKINTSTNEVKEYKLSQNYPNPFNPVTTIHYAVKEPGLVTLKLYDLLGREAATLVNENKAYGNYTINFDASGLSSGIYVCRMKVNEFSSLMKMIVLK